MVEEWACFSLEQTHSILRVKLRLNGWMRGKDALHRGHWASGTHHTSPLPFRTQVQQGDRQSASECSQGEARVMCDKETSGVGRRE